MIFYNRKEVKVMHSKRKWFRLFLNGLNIKVANFYFNRYKKCIDRAESFVEKELKK